MKKLILFFVLLWSVVLHSQSGPTSGNYLPVNSTGYNWAWGYFRSLGLPTYSGAPNGTSSFQSKQYWGDGAVYRDSVAHKTYVFNGTTKVWDEIGGAAITIPGNAGNIFFRGLDGLLHVAGSDSLSWTSEGLRVGAAITSTALVQISSNGSSPILNVGTASHANGYWVNFEIPEDVASNTGMKVLGNRFNRHTTVTANNQSWGFRYGGGIGWKIELKDSLHFANQNNDAISAFNAGFEFVKSSGQTGRSVISSGGGVFDHAASTFSALNFVGGSGTNNFVVTGWLSNYIGYTISDNPNHTDSVQNISVFYAGGAGDGLSPKIGYYRVFVASPEGGTGANIYKKYFGYYGMKGSAAPINFFHDGTMRIIGTPASNIAGDNGDDTARFGATIDLGGKLAIIDGTQGAGKIFMSDANGLGHWQDTTGLFPGTGGGGGGGLPSGLAWNAGTGEFDINTGYIRDNGTNMRFFAGSSGNYQFFNAANSVVEFYNSAGGDGVQIYGFARSINAISGTGGISIGSGSPNASAKLDVQSTTLGLLGPRMTTTQKNAISSPAEGLEVFDLTTHSKYYYNGSSWVAYGSSSSAGSSTQIQFNTSGSFAASSKFTYDEATAGRPNLTLVGDYPNLSLDYGASSTAGSIKFYGPSGIEGGIVVNSTYDASWYLGGWGAGSPLLTLKQSTNSLGINTSPATSAKLDVASTTQGVLLPRMTTTQKNAISSPAEGLEVYDLTLHKKCVYTGSAWETVTSL